MGAHSLKNVKEHIGNEHLLIPGLRVHLNFILIHVKGFIHLIILIVLQIINRCVQAHPCFVLYFIIGCVLYFFTVKSFYFEINTFKI